MKLKAALILTGLVLIAGCAHDVDKLDASQVSIVPERHETRVYLMEDCPVEPRPRRRVLGAIALALTPLLVDGALSAVENFMRAREAALSGAHAAHTSGRLYDAQGNLDFGCVVVVRGRFGMRRADIGEDARRGSLEVGHLTTLGLATFPDFYFEAWAALEPTGDDQSPMVMKVTPQVVQLARTAAKRLGSGAKTVNILLLLSRTAQDPNQAPDQDKAFAVLPFQFESIEIGTEISRDLEQRSLLAHHALVTGIPPASVEGERLVVPFNLAAYVEETEQAGPFQKLLLEVFTRKKAGLESSLTEIISGAIQAQQGK